MGISDEVEDGSGVVDTSVGTIVWVRRRNGSWWPGRILGPEELAMSHLLSPRSGTPVKLLGRDDASVDWYNLEKSKRVKAFRCGEFDSCIRRAEASQCISIKKREKYARREDAILHALELERRQIEMKNQKLGTISNGASRRNSDAHRRELRGSSDTYKRVDDPRVYSTHASQKSRMKKAVVSGEEDSMGKGKTIEQSSWEDYKDSLPRTRELQDFGIMTVPPKKKVSQWEVSQKPVDISVKSISSMGNMMQNASHVGSSKTSPAAKRKRSQNVDGEDSIVKRHDRHRPLGKVLQSNKHLSVSYSFQSEYDSGGVPLQLENGPMGILDRAKRSSYTPLPADSNDSLDGNECHSEDIPGNELELISNHLDYPGSLIQEYSTSGLAEETESDSSETDSLQPDTEEDANSTDSTLSLVPRSNDCKSPSVQVSEIYKDLNDDEVTTPGYIVPLYLQDQMMNADGDRKWHMKGKRNIRSLTKRPIDLFDGKKFSNADRPDDPNEGKMCKSMESSIKMRRMYSSSQRTPGQTFSHKKGSSHFVYDGVNLVEKDAYQNQLTGTGGRRHPFSTQVPRDNGSSHNSFNDSDSDSHLLPPARWRVDRSLHMVGPAYWEESDECSDPDYTQPLADEMESVLTDVDVLVEKQSYRREHVPWVSLSSKSNGGKPVLGHPVQIEILEDGSASHLVSRYDFGLEESSIPAFSKTAKRSVMHRTPRSKATTSMVYEDTDQFDSDQEFKPYFKKSYTDYLNHQAKGSIASAQRPTMPGKFQKKVLTKVSMPSQKTRTLSSFATGQKLGGDRATLKHSRSDILDGLIRPGGQIPLVACVPVKVVFSRILEAVERPSSVHRARLANPASRGLL